MKLAAQTYGAILFGYLLEWVLDVAQETAEERAASAFRAVMVIG